jgi:hypothetical protein
MTAKILVIDDNKSRFEEVTQKRGFDVKAFTVFKDAMNWLSTITLVRFLKTNIVFPNNSFTAKVAKDAEIS